jgi:hypothetical protein
VVARSFWGVWECSYLTAPVAALWRWKIYEGQVYGYVSKYSDTLLIFLLSRHLSCAPQYPGQLDAEP